MHQIQENFTQKEFVEPIPPPPIVPVPPPSVLPILPPARVPVTVFKKNGLFTKLISQDGEGELVKNSSHCAMSDGEFRTEYLDYLGGFNTLLDGLESGEATCYGINNQQKGAIVSKKNQSQFPQSITRTKENFTYPEGEAVMMIDYDPKEGESAFTPEVLYVAIISALPELIGVSILWRASASSGIYNGNMEVSGITGQRLYFFVSNGNKIPQIGKLITDRIWLMGYGRIEFSKSGNMLKRTLADAAVWHPTGLDFAAPASCVEPLHRKPISGRIFKGKSEVLDVDKIKWLSNEEKENVKEKIRQAKIEAKPEQVEVKNNYIQERLSGLEGAERTHMEKILTLAVNDRYLTSEMPLLLDDYGVVLVGDVLADKLKYHGATGADPLEPEYGGGKCKAKLFLTGTKPTYHSFAHGGRTFNLRIQTREVEIADGMLHEIRNSFIETLDAEPDIFSTQAGIVVVEGLGAKVVNADTITIRISANCKCYRNRSDGNGGYKRVDTNPPERPIRNIVNSVGNISIKKLEGIISAPTLRPDGSIIQNPGYDKETALLMQVDEPPPLIPENPTKEQVEQSLELLMSPYVHYPFETKTDEAVLLSALLTAVVRKSLPTAPGYIISGTAAGAGKTKLATCIALHAGGDKATQSLPRDNEELVKKVTGSLISMARSLLFDNVSGVLRSDFLCNIVTTPEYDNRLLGTNKIIKLSTNIMLLFTGNNLSAAGDLSRRLLPINLEVKEEKPWSTNFPFDPVVMVSKRRIEFICAALTLLRGFIAANSPCMVSAHTGSFEGWSRLIRQTVIWVGLPDPEEAMHSNQDNDPDTDDLRELMHVWLEKFGTKFVSNKEIDCQFPAHGVTNLGIACSGLLGKRELSVRNLGYYLKFKKGKRLDGYYFDNNTVNNERGWKLEKVVND